MRCLLEVTGQREEAASVANKPKPIAVSRHEPLSKFRSCPPGHGQRSRCRPRGILILLAYIVNLHSRVSRHQKDLERQQKELQRLSQHVTDLRLAEHRRFLAELRIEKASAEARQLDIVSPPPIKSYGSPCRAHYRGFYCDRVHLPNWHPPSIPPE